ncbi:hypothetical protein QP185_18980 [Sphingomonas aerolata]
MPAALVTLIVAPGAPVPVARLPSPLIVAVGASGAVVSGASRPAGAETFPARSACTTDSASPSSCGVRATA